MQVRSKLLNKKAIDAKDLPGYGQTDENEGLKAISTKFRAELIDWDKDGDIDDIIDMNYGANLVISYNKIGAEAAIMLMGFDGKKILLPLSAYYNLNMDGLVKEAQTLSDALEQAGLTP